MPHSCMLTVTGAVVTHISQGNEFISVCVCVWQSYFNLTYILTPPLPLPNLTLMTLFSVCVCPYLFDSLKLYRMLIRSPRFSDWTQLSRVMLKKNFCIFKIWAVQMFEPDVCLWTLFIPQPKPLKHVIVNMKYSVPWNVDINKQYWTGIVVKANMAHV